MSDKINPEHYKRLPVEAIEIIESAIEGAPTKVEAYLQGQALKYLLRANHKNGREDMLKAKWYLDRMVASFKVSSDLLDHSSWTPKVGDWVRIKKPKKDDHNIGIWFDHMDKYDGQIVQVSEIDEDVLIYGDGWGFLLDWLEQAEPPKGQPQLPDDWRWLEVGEVIRKGDRCFTNHSGWIDCLTSFGEEFNHEAHYPIIRRNKFEVGEKVLRVSNGVVYKVIRILSMGYQLESEFCAEVILYGKDLAPYVEETT